MGLMLEKTINGKTGNYWMIRKFDGNVALLSLYENYETRKEYILNCIHTITYEFDKQLTINEAYSEIKKSDIRKVLISPIRYGEIEDINDTPQILEQAVYEDREFNEFVNAINI